MNISNIKAGDTFPNYKQLCVVLEEPVKTGKSKQIQLEDFQRYFTYYKVGNKYIIESIFEAPLIKFNSKGIYNNIMQLIITDYLLKSKDSTVIITANKLLLYMYMYNDNYYACNEYIPQLSKYTNIDQRTIYDFYNTSGGSFRKSLESALNSLRNKALLMYEKLIYVCTSENNHRRAREYEKNFIIKVETEILQELGFEDIEHVRISPKWYLFKSMIVKRLKEIDLKYHYICYSLTVNRDYIENNHNILLQFTINEIEKHGLKIDLNNKVMTRLIENAHSRQSKAFASGKKSQMRGNKKYIEDMSKLIHILIDVNANNIKGEMESIKRQEEEEIRYIAEMDDLFC